jgi:pantothenate kinase
MSASLTDLGGLIRLIEMRGSGRLIVGIAGAPGSGKSTIARHLEISLNANHPGFAAILPMDGFHFDDLLLEKLNRRARKGAPDTFDVGGFGHLLMRLRNNTEDSVAVPVFDRDIEIARGGARLIARDVSVIIVEGNYLLLKMAPWSLKSLFDLTVMVDTSIETLRARLTKRWAGYNLEPAEIRRRVEENDLPNGKFVMTESAEPDYRLEN